jgi:regulator of protease activity HflC (stomatin/prohibitin superfamily)
MDSSTISYLILAVVALLCLGGLLGSFFTVNTAERGVVERFNKFSRVAGPGPSLK